LGAPPALETTCSPSVNPLVIDADALRIFLAESGAPAPPKDLDPDARNAGDGGSVCWP